MAVPTNTATSSANSQAPWFWTSLAFAVPFYHSIADLISGATPDAPAGLSGGGSTDANGDTYTRFGLATRSGTDSSARYLYTPDWNSDFTLCVVFDALDYNNKNTLQFVTATGDYWYNSGSKCIQTNLYVQSSPTTYGTYLSLNSDVNAPRVNLGTPTIASGPHLLVLRRASSTFTINYNGSTYTETASGNYVDSANQALAIGDIKPGGSYGGAYKFNGGIYCASVHSRALSDSEVSQLITDPYIGYRAVSSGTTVPVSITLGTGSYARQTYVPVLNIGTHASLQSSALTRTDNAINIAAGARTQMQPGAYATSGGTLTTQAGANLSLQTQQTTRTGNPVTAQAGVNAEIGTQSLSLTQFAAQLVAGQSVQIETSAYTLTGNSLSVQAGNAVTIQIGTSNKTLTGHVPQIKAGQSVTIGTSAKAIARHQIQMRAGVNTRLTASSYTLAGHPISVLIQGKGWLTADAITITPNLSAQISLSPLLDADNVTIKP